MRWISVFFLIISVGFAALLDVEIKAASAVLMNAKTGAILFEKHAHRPTHPASTTKIATALFLLDRNIDLEQKVLVSQEALKERSLKDPYSFPAHFLESDGTMMWLRVGESISLRSLLYGMMLVSGNDAANTIAENIGGSIPGFMEDMNEYLRGIGCLNTQYKNPHGLTHPEHWTTAYDLALMTKNALHFPGFRKAFSSLTFTVPKTNKNAERKLEMTNPFIRPKSRYFYAKAIGGKTGYTSAAQNTLVAVAEHKGRVLIATLLGCVQRHDRYEDAKRLFERAFQEEKISRRLIGPEHVFEKSIEGAPLLKASVLRPIRIYFFPSEEPRCKARLHWSVDHLPIYKGQKVGEIEIVDQGGLVLEKGDLLAKKELKGSFFYHLKRFFLSFL